MGFFDVFKRNKRSIDLNTIIPDGESAISVLFGQSRLDNSASTLSAFFAARELISNSVAQLPITIKLNNELDTNHNLNMLFKNCMMSKFNLLKQLVQDVIDYGNAICYIERAADGTPIDLIYCEHGTYNIHYTQNKKLLYYTIGFCRKGRIEPIDVIHLYKNTYNGFEGKSLVSYANMILNLAKSTDKAARNFYDSGCAIQGALTIKGARKGAKEQARQAFMDTHSGTNSSGLVILDDDMTYTPLSLNANDSQMLQTRTFNVTEIARYFNINPVLLGDLTKSSYNTIEAANIEFVTHTLMPYIAMIEHEFNRKLIKPSEKGYTIDLDETYLIKGDKNSTAQYLEKLVSSGIITRNEARHQLGLNDIDGLDDIIIPYTNINNNTIGNNSDDEEKINDKEEDEG